MSYYEEDSMVGLGLGSRQTQPPLEQKSSGSASQSRRKKPLVPKFDDSSKISANSMVPEAKADDTKKPADLVPKVDLDFINKLYNKNIDQKKDKDAEQKPVKKATVSNYVKPSYKVKDEYDPARPNDYEQIAYERDKKEKEEEAKREQGLQEEESQIVEEEEPSAEEKVLKMLEKQGWKMGEGLGKYGQGMTTPLIAKKTAHNTAVIVNSVLDVSSVLPEEIAQKKAREALYNRPPTRVIVLLNMVSPDEVDDTLEAEVTEECTVYGNVLGCHLVEIKNVPEEEAIRIFVEFEKKEEAEIAFGYIYGRFFGGRNVIVKFYDEEDYQQKKLFEQL